MPKGYPQTRTAKTGSDSATCQTVTKNSTTRLSDARPFISGRRNTVTRTILPGFRRKDWWEHGKTSTLVRRRTPRPICERVDAADMVVSAWVTSFASRAASRGPAISHEQGERFVLQVLKERDRTQVPKMELAFDL